MNFEKFFKPPLLLGLKGYRVNQIKNILSEKGLKMVFENTEGDTELFKFSCFHSNVCLSLPLYNTFLALIPSQPCNLLMENNSFKTCFYHLLLQIFERAVVYFPLKKENRINNISFVIAGRNI